MKPKPWIGDGFNRRNSDKLLILGESGYPWKDDNGAWQRPGEAHATDCARWMMCDKTWKPGEARDGGKTLFQITRALANCENPDRAARERAWHSCAFINYVHCTSRDRRPTNKQLIKARQPFLDLLEKYRPRHVVALGKTMWKHMPPNCVPGHYRRGGDLQAYRLANGSLVWVLALPHPAAKYGGAPPWRSYAMAIAKFRGEKLPAR